MQVLPPQVTYDKTTDLTKGTQQLDTPRSGVWTATSAGYVGSAPASTQGIVPVTLAGITRLASTAWTEVTARFTTAGVAGLAFDAYASGYSKFAAIDVPNQRVVLGHIDSRGNYVIDASAAQALTAGTAYTMTLTLKGASASVTAQRRLRSQLRLQRRCRRRPLRPDDAGRQRDLHQPADPDRRQRPRRRSPRRPPVPDVSVADVSTTEGGSGTKSVTVTLTLSAPAVGTVTVPWTLSPGTASAGTDYVNTSGTVTFVAGQQQATFTVSVVGDTTVEANETFSVLLGTVTGATVSRGTATVTILNDDLPVVSISSLPRSTRATRAASAAPSR